MKFKNFEGIEYTVNYTKPLGKYNASGLSHNPEALYLPNLWVNIMLRDYVIIQILKILQ